MDTEKPYKCPSCGAHIAPRDLFKKWDEWHPFKAIVSADGNPPIEYGIYHESSEALREYLFRAAEYHGHKIIIHSITKALR
jgi:hypothetical protein